MFSSVVGERGKIYKAPDERRVPRSQAASPILTLAPAPAGLCSSCGESQADGGRPERQDLQRRTASASPSVGCLHFHTQLLLHRLNELL